MPTESIVFAPELDERQLDRETQTVNDQLADVGQDVPVSFDPDELDLPGGGISGGGGGGVGGAAGTGAAAGLASRIPKSVAGVGVAAAVPVALGGAVGAGLLSAMTSASGKLQTQQNLLGIMVDNFFREPGNILAEAINPAIMEGVNLSQRFDEALRDRDFGEAGEILLEIPQGATGELLADLIPATFGAQLIGKVGQEIADASPTLERGFEEIVNGFPTFEWPELPSFDWPDLPSFNWPSLPSFNWPDLPTFSWPNLPTFEWPSSNDILRQFPNLNVNNLRQQILGENPLGGDGDDRGGEPDPVPSQDRGGTERFPGREDSRTPGAPGGSTRGGGDPTGPTRPDQTPGYEMTGTENRLDELNRNFRRLADRLNLEVNVDGETIARTAEEARWARLADRDPTI